MYLKGLSNLILFAFALLGTVVSGKTATPDPDALRQLQNLALAYERSGKKDEFSETPRAGKALGKSFRFVIPLNSVRSGSPASHLSSARYEYENGTLNVYLDYWFGNFEAFEPARVVNLGSYTGVTSLGRRMSVDRERIEKVGVSVMNILPRKGWEETEHGPQSFRFSFQTSGPEARRLATSLRYEIEGSIAQLSDGRSVSCETVVGRPPSLDDPVKFTIHSCTVAVTADRISLVDKLTGKTVKVWRDGELTRGLLSR